MTPGAAADTSPMSADNGCGQREMSADISADNEPMSADNGAAGIVVPFESLRLLTSRLRTDLAALPAPARIRLCAQITLDATKEIEAARVPRMNVTRPVNDNRRPLTERQRAVYEWIREYIAINRMSPTLREIAVAFSIKSTNGVNDHLRYLEAKGYIERVGSALSRSIRLVDVDRERSA